MDVRPGRESDVVPTLLILFLLVAAGGAGLALLEHRGRTLPLPVSSLHGGIAAVLIGALVWHDLQAPGNRLVNAATVVFVLAATGGLLLFAFRASRQRLPLPVVLLHGAFALAAWGLLLAGVVRG
ncbi:MAG TPA: hypothetical protein VGS99_09800 [Gammaproteobacteria bacterium]|nr:hypothetical protein [Gammaproteobacteria bacterium]